MSDQQEAQADRAEFRAGDAVEVLEMGHWWPAEVLKVQGGRVKIHFTGWDSSWDRVVSAKEVRRPTAGASGGESAVVAEARPTVLDPISSMLSGQPVTAATPLRPGQRVQAQWHGYWFEAEVVEVRADGRVKIHYVGWGSYWDEVVPRSNLQLQGTAQRSVFVELVTGTSLTGTYQGMQGGFLVLARADTGNRAFINQMHVAYFEEREEEDE